MYVIFGATGQTGKAAAERLLGRGKKVRVVARHREALLPFEKMGAEAVVADILDPRATAAALAGGEAAYVLVPPSVEAEDFRAYQKKVSDSIGDGIEAAGVKHVVLLSSIGADHSTGTGPIVGLYECEQRLRRIAGLNALFVRAGYFMQNLFLNLELMKAKGENPGAIPGDVAIAMVFAPDIGAYVGDRLEKLEFQGASAVNFAGPSLSMNQATSALGASVGRKLQYIQVPYELAEAGMRQAGIKPQLAALYAEMSRAITAGLLSPELGTPSDKAPTTFEQFAANVFAPAFKA